MNDETPSAATNRMISLRLILPLFLGLLLPLCTAAQSSKQTRRILVGENETFAVALEITSPADSLDSDWLKIMMLNKTSQPLVVEDLFYQMTRQGQKSVEGLGSGTEFDLFPECWTVKPVAPRILQPGVTIKYEEPSLYAAGMLGNKRGQVRANLTFEVYFSNGTEFSTPPSGIPFEFIWNGGGQSREDVQKRARMILDQPLAINPPGRAHYVNSLLAMAPLTAEELVARRASLQPDEHERDARHWVIRRALQDYEGNPVVVRSDLDLYARNRLSGPFDLIGWNEAYKEMLLRRSAACSPEELQEIASYFNQYRTRWQNDARVRQVVNSAGKKPNSPSRTIAKLNPLKVF